MKSILDRAFQYAPAKSHEGSADAFKQRQAERLAKAQAEAQAKVRPIKQERKP